MLLSILVLVALTVSPVGPASAQEESSAVGVDVASSPPTTVLTLDEAVRLALLNSPQLKASREKIEQSRAQLKQAYALLLPFISAQGNYSLADQEISLDFGNFGELFALAAMNCALWKDEYGPIPSLCTAPPAPADASDGGDEEDSARVIQERHNFDGSLTVGISLLNLRTWPLIQNVYTGRELTRLQVDFAEEQLVYSVVQMYYGISTAQAVVSLLEQTVATALRHMEFTEIRVKNGAGLQNERVRAAMGVVQARSQLDQALVALGSARRSLAVLIGREDSNFAVEENPAHPWQSETPEGDPAARVGQRLDIRMLEKMEVMAERGVTDVWMRFVPTVQAMWNGSWSSNTGFAGSHTQWRAIVSLNWTILEGGLRFGQIDEARSKVREARYNRDVVELGARMEVEQALTAIESAQKDLATAGEMAKLAAENLDLVEKQYKAGVAQQTVIIDAEQQVRSAQILELQGKLKLALATISLVRSAGKLKTHSFK